MPFQTTPSSEWTYICIYVYIYHICIFRVLVSSRVYIYDIQFTQEIYNHQALSKYPWTWGKNKKSRNKGNK